MSELIPETAPESAIVEGRRRMPGWAIALCVAIVAVSAAMLGLGLSLHYWTEYRHDVYNRCVANNAGNAQFVKVLDKLRDADAQTLAEARKTPPTTEFGKIDLQGVAERVSAYDDLLKQTKIPLPDCSKLK